LFAFNFTTKIAQIGSLHTEAPSNSPPTENFASEPLQGNSEAFSSILTTKRQNYLRFRPRQTRTPNLRLRPIFPRRPKFYLRKILHSGIRTLNQHGIYHKSFSTPKSRQRNSSPTNHKSDQNYDKTPPILKLMPKINQKLKNPFTHAQLRLQATHATFSYPLTVETFFDDDTDHDSQHESRHIPATSANALTSSF
jgi:hypothetical protein